MALQTESGPLEMAYNWHACPSAARLPKEPCFVLPQELVSCVPRFEVTALRENTHEFCVTTKPRSCGRLLPTLRRGSRSEREQAEARGPAFERVVPPGAARSRRLRRPRLVDQE